MLTERAILVIGLTLLGVVAFNVMIFLAWRDGSLNQMIDSFRRAAHRANDPWEDENKSLSELNQRVKQLRSSGTTAPHQDTQKDGGLSSQDDENKGNS